MTARLGTTLSTLLARFRRRPVLLPPLPEAVSTDLMREYDKRTAEMLADEEAHELALSEAQLNAVATQGTEEERCLALSDVISGRPCVLGRENPHRSGHDWDTGGIR